MKVVKCVQVLIKYMVIIRKNIQVCGYWLIPIIPHNSMLCIMFV